MCESAHPNPQCPHTYGSHYFLRDESEKKVILVGYPRAAAPVMEDASVDDERFGALRLPRGGKHGYRGVRGGQGKKRDRFQAYTTVASTKVTVPGLFQSAHEAAVALALWKQQHELGIDEEVAPKKARKKRSSALAERPSTSLWQRWRYDPAASHATAAYPVSLGRLASSSSNSTACHTSNNYTCAAAARYSSSRIRRARGPRSALVGRDRGSF